jgi:hypothetical protein
MRVNISYSIELEDVPEEVCKLLASERKEQEKILIEYTNITSAVQSGELVVAIQKLDAVRKTMGKLDARLQDMISILNGFVQVENQKENPEQFALAENFEEGTASDTEEE